MTVTERFAALVRGPEECLPLDEAALLLAAHAEPDLDVSGQLHRLDELAARCPEPSVHGVRALLFDDLGLRGNTIDYSDPRNSFLDQVLDRGLGIPISLSVITIEVGRRLGVPFEGVGMPGHFLVRHAGDPPVLLDPFHGGVEVTADRCESLFETLFGPDVPFSPSLLAATGRRHILARMLANLKNSYRERSDAAALAWVARLRAFIPGVPHTELADLARQLVNLGQLDQAADALDELASSVSLTKDEAHQVRSRASQLRARLN